MKKISFSQISLLKQHSKLNLKSFKSKSIILLILIVFFPMLISGIVSAILLQKSVNEGYVENIKKTAVDVSSIIDEKFNTYESLIALLSKNTKIVDSIKANSSPIIKYELQSIVESNPNIKGAFITTQSNTSISYPDYNLISNFKYEKNSYYDKVIANYNVPLWSDVMKNSINSNMTCVLSKSIYDNSNNSIGIIGIIIDISDITKLFSTITSGKTGQIILIDKNGIIIASRYKDLVGKKLENTNWAKKLLSGKSGFVESKFYGQTRYLHYMNNFKSGWKIISSINKDEIYIKINFMSMILIIILLLFIIIAVLTGIWLSGSTINAVKLLVNAMKKGEKGDLTTTVNIKSHDELGALGYSFNNMINTMREFIKTAKDSANILLQSSSIMRDKTSYTQDFSNRISNDASKMSSGAKHQESEVNKSFSIIHDFNDSMHELNSSNNKLSCETQSIKKVLSNSSIVIAELDEKNSLTKYSIKNIEERISELARKVESIIDFLKSIKSISSETNILALNAAIEAARVGEYGKGFSVVADEIRTLSTQTTDFAENIQGLTIDIKKSLHSTILEMNNINTNVQVQTEKVELTKNAFKNIDNSILNVISFLDNMSSKIIELADKSNIINSCTNAIYEVTQQSSSISYNINTYIDQQLEDIEEINTKAEDLNHLANNLHSIISRFKI